MKKESGRKRSKRRKLPWSRRKERHRHAHPKSCLEAPDTSRHPKSCLEALRSRAGPPNTSRHPSRAWWASGVAQGLPRHLQERLGPEQVVPGGPQKSRRTSKHFQTGPSRQRHILGDILIRGQGICTKLQSTRSQCGDDKGRRHVRACAFRVRACSFVP